MITAKNIYKTYGNVRVLRGVDIEVEKSSIVAIVGPSGAGKTTLLQILGTLDLPDKETESVLQINQQSTLRLSDKEMSKFRNQQIGFIFQFHHLLPEFTAFENVCIPGFIAQRNRKEVEKEAHKLLNFLGLSHRLHHKPNEMSGGEQQRVAVARALINNPSVIFADEPSGNLDSEAAKNLHQLFFDLRNQFGQTFVIVTHNKELAQMADKIIEMKDGIIVNGQ